MCDYLDYKLSRLALANKALIGKLSKIKIETVRDLIFYYPFRYEDYSKFSLINDLKPDSQAAVIGKIELIANRRSFRSRKILTEAIITDESGSIKMLWFNQPWLIKSLKSGQTVKVWGKVGGDNFNPIFMAPEYQLIIAGQTNAPGLIPIYPLTAGLTSHQLNSLIKKIRTELSPLIDFLSADLLDKYKLMPLDEAVENIHFPKNQVLLAQAKKRLAFDELFLIQAVSQLAKKNLLSAKSFPVDFSETAVKSLISSLPFELTLDQKKAAWEIIKDLRAEHPMNRLLDGDVGSGKTIVALLAMFNCLASGYQTALMVPTEILAGQHYDNFLSLLAGQKIKVALLTGSTCLLDGEKIKKTELVTLLQKDEPVLIVGTHALIQEKIRFLKLALAVVDEQHRFGVKQRKALKEKNISGISPHFLSLTATPIPRSLSLALLGDLDISLIKTKPIGRKIIISKVVKEENRFKAYEFIRGQINNGGQVFVICPLIDQSDKMGFKSVKEEQQKLNEHIFPEFNVGLLHGRLKEEEKEKVMADFKGGHIQILVSTSVVEVGIDIANATVMMIEGADRFGLAQLHQFRGRVGRGKHQSYCFVFTESNEEKTLAKLEFLAGCSDGFQLAEFDLKHRGGGSVWSEEQSGFLTGLKLADINDWEAVKIARLAALEFISLIGDKLERFYQRFGDPDFIDHPE